MPEQEDIVAAVAYQGMAAACQGMAAAEQDIAAAACQGMVAACQGMAVAYQGMVAAEQDIVGPGIDRELDPDSCHTESMVGQDSYEMAADIVVRVDRTVVDCP